MHGKRTKFYRFLEIVPGALIWATLMLAVLLSFVKPIWMIYFVIIFSVFWLFRVVYFIFYTLVTWRRYRKAIKTNWLEKVRALPKWDSYLHLIVMPTYKEPIEVLRTSLESYVKADYPCDKMVIVLAGEERDKEQFLSHIDILKQEFDGVFKKMLFTLHPDGLEGEIKAKAANASWAGHKAKQYIDEENIPYEKVIVSYFDCDTAVHPQYFGHLAHTYMTHPNPTRASYQPIVMYNNNIWDAPSFTRIVAFGTTFWLMTELSRPNRLITYSSHAMSFKALVDVGFWQKDVVSDDSRIFYQCLIHYNGEYEVAPLYTPLSMDSVLAGTHSETLISLYKQQRRWAWGVEHFPYLVVNFIKNKEMKLGKKLYYLFNQAEGMFTWATVPLLLLLLTNLPFWMTQGAERQSVLVQTAPTMVNLVLTMAMAGILVSLILATVILPPRPNGHGRHKYLFMILQWLLLPVSLIIFGSVPSIDAQTRLMFGKYMGFFCTPKARKN